jgi:uncharacterized protein (DUF1330 family)
MGSDIPCGAPTVASRGASACAVRQRALVSAIEPCKGARVDTTIALYPNAEQIQTLLTGPADQPIAMLNLLRFKPRGDAPDEDVSGEDAYRRYADPMIAYVQSQGARVIWSGRVASQVIGSGGEGFHMVALVEYPSRAAFLQIATDPHVEKIGVHRAAGLDGQWLIAATPDVV